jgi:hypothetical protein
MAGNLFVGRNLLVGVSATYFPLDVSGAVNFRGVVNPFQLPDGSVLATAALPIDYVNGFGVTWNTAANTPSATNWKSCAISANGQTQVACVTNGSIYTSLNYGVFWTKSNASNANWNSISMASSGQYQAASINSGYIFTSTNFGVFWTQQTNSGSRAWTGVVMSATGQYVSGCVSSGYIYYSTNFGVNWVQSLSTTPVWSGISMSYNAQYQSACVNSGYIYNSTNFGVNWTQSSSLSLAWTTIAVSATGQYQTAGVNSGYIFASSNYGISWTQTNSISANWQNISMSANGQYLTATTSSSGNVYTSINYGVDWSQQLYSPTKIWNSSAISSNAQYVLGAPSSGPMYTSITPYSNFAASNIMPIIDDGSGCFINFQTASGDFYFSAGKTNPTNNINIINSSGVGVYLASSAATSWSSISDIRLKKNIVPVDESLDKILQLKPCTFNWKYQEDTESKISGFIAQEVEEVLPGLVTNSVHNDGIEYKGITMTNMIPYLVKAIKEQQSIISTLKTNNATLISKITELTATIEKK